VKFLEVALSILHFSMSQIEKSSLQGTLCLIEQDWMDLSI